MMRCLRCNEQTPRCSVDQVHCPRCAVEVAALITPKPAPAWQPAWLARVKDRDETGRILNGGAL